jgi:hypothetical protein
MRKRILIAASLGILLAQGVTLAMEQPPAMAEVERPQTAEGQQIVTIVEVKYYPVRELAGLLEVLSGGEGTHVLVDDNANRLIVQGTPQRVEGVLRLVRQLDVGDVSALSAQYLACRIFMLEIPRRGQNVKPFAVVLKTPSPVLSAQMLEALKGEDLQIGRLLQGHEGDPRILIKGLAASNDAVKRMIQGIPDSQISELKWGDEMLTPAVPTAQFNQLPEQLQEHIRRFLGPEIHTVGYWFGNVSFPGEVMAPIGTWVLQLKAQPAQGADLHLEIEVTQTPELAVDSPAIILSNSIQGKVGKPIIVGYNRDSYGTRTMGALVIILEADTQSRDSETKAP